MRRLTLPAGIAALGLLAIVYAACSGASSLEPTPTSPPAPTPTATPAAKSAAAGPPQVEAGAPIVEPTSGPPKREAKVVYVGQRDVRAVALTFDVGVQAAHVPEILDILKEQGKRATFGITGEWAVTNPDLLKRMVEEGHAIINHSWSHASFTGEATGTEPLTADQIRDELERTEKKIQEIAEVSTKPYFRPPYGDFDPGVNTVAYEAGYPFNVLWLVDSLGWEGRSPDSIAAVTLASAFNGAIFLYHTDNNRDFAALEKIIEGLNERGLQMVTIPQLLGEKPIPSPTPRPSPTPTPAPVPPPAPGLTPTRIPTPVPTVAPPGPTPTPTPIPAPVESRIAYDDFESGDAYGGAGWLGPWQSVGVFATSAVAPRAGDWQLDLTAAVLVYRVTDLAGQEGVHLRFWSRLSRLDPSHRAIVLVSANGGLDWQIVKQFTEAEADGVYRFYDIDLSGVEVSDSFAVGFYALTDPAVDLWHIDDVELAALAP